MTTSDSLRIWKAWKTITEMMADRKYNVPFDALPSYEAFAKKPVARADFAEVFVKTDGDTEKPANKLLVVMRERIGNPQILELHIDMDERGVDNAIIIYSEKITPSAEAAIRFLRIKKKNIEVFTEASLQFNVTRHSFVPRHCICSIETKTNVLKKYNITLKELPEIKITDPVCRYYGAKKGQMVEITRVSDSIKSIMLEGKKKILYDVTYKIVV